MGEGINTISMSDHDLLLRIDERTENLQKTVEGMKENLRVNYVDKHECYPFRKMTEQSLDRHITREEFAPIKKVVYGLVGATLMTIFLGLISLIVKS